MVLRALVITILICLAVPSPAISQESEQPLSIKGMDWNTTQLFMAGMGYGVIYFNTALLLDGKPELYCTALDVSVNGRVLWDLASKALAGPHEPDVVAIAALAELKKRYPCTK